MESNTYLNLLGASFNELGSEIHLFLDGFTDQAGLDAIFECSELFANWQEFGNCPQCFWVSASRLVISLGHGRTIAVGDSLELTRPIHSQDLTKVRFNSICFFERILHCYFFQNSHTHAYFQLMYEARSKFNIHYFLLELKKLFLKMCFVLGGD